MSQDPEVILAELTAVGVLGVKCLSQEVGSERIRPRRPLVGSVRSADARRRRFHCRNA
jgi:hypothetical protein